MNLLLVGTSHRVADVATRERLAALVGHDARRAMPSAPAVAEWLVLATCHRVECYAVAGDPAAAERDLLARFGHDGHAGADSETNAPIYVRHGRAALEHLCRVACGLDSVIVGESEISGQIRRAVAQARAAGTIGPYLDRAVAGALRASGRARTETGIARGAISAASAGVLLACSMTGSLADRTVLVIGAGQAGRQALARLRRVDVGRLLVASRSPHHAHKAAEASGAEVLPFDRIGQAIAETDVLIVAVQAPTPVVAASDCRRAPGKPLLVVDLSVPRGIEAAAADLEGVTVRTIDDLGDIARASLARRAEEIPRVEALAREEAHRACEQLRARARRRAARIS